MFFFLLVGCTSPVYQTTTFDIDDFISDSEQIARGKYAILALEKQESFCLFDDVSPTEIIMEGDELSIAVYCPQRPDRAEAIEIMNQRAGFRVCDGKIHLPHLPCIELVGLTLNEGRKLIELAYNEGIQNSKIFLNFKKQQERRVQIIGAKEAMVLVDGRMRLSEVLARAGLKPSSNLFKSYVIRNKQQLPIDLYQLVVKGDENQNMIMQGGDQIFIANAADASIMVTGEIPRPIVLPVPYGFVSLREALVIAGGIPFTGNKNSIQIIRGNLTRPKIYCMSWNDMLHLPNASLLLMTGDIVVVSEKPITQWNRFINQLQPSTACMQTGYNSYRFFKGMR